MDKAEILRGLREIIGDVLGVDGAAISVTTTATDVPEWDSLAHINIIVAAEQRFGVKFGTAEIDELRTVGDFADLIARKRGG
jgi:acyl carrier protein